MKSVHSLISSLTAWDWRRKTLSFLLYSTSPVVSFLIKLPSKRKQALGNSVTSTATWISHSYFHIKSLFIKPWIWFIIEKELGF
jgi:hypothetical protein